MNRRVVSILVASFLVCGGSMVLAQESEALRLPWIFPGTYADIEQIGSWGTGAALAGPGVVMTDPAALAQMPPLRVRGQVVWTRPVITGEEVAGPDLDDGAFDATNWRAYSAGLGFRLGPLGGVGLLGQRNESDGGDRRVDLFAAGWGIGHRFRDLGLDFGLTYRHEIWNGLGGVGEEGDDGLVRANVGGGLALWYRDRLRISAHYARLGDVENEITDIVPQPDRIELSANLLLLRTEGTRLSAFVHSTGSMIARVDPHDGLGRQHYAEEEALRYGLAADVGWFAASVSYGNMPVSDDQGVQLGITLRPVSSIWFGGGLRTTSESDREITEHGGSLVIGSSRTAGSSWSRNYVAEFNDAWLAEDIVRLRRIATECHGSVSMTDERVMKVILLIYDLDAAGYRRFAASFIPLILEHARTFEAVMDLIVIDTIQSVAVNSSGRTVVGNHYDLHLTADAGGPYLVTDDIRIMGGGTLTVDAGVVVKFQRGSSLIMLPQSRLIVKGTAGEPVVFTSIHNDLLGDTNGDGDRTQPEPGDWEGIRFQGDAPLIDARNFEVEFSNTQDPVRQHFVDGTRFTHDLTQEFMERMNEIENLVESNER